MELDSAAQSRLQVIAEKLLAEGADAEVVDRLIDFVSSADDFALARIRPYALADEWKLSRRAVLEACLRSTRLGLLDLQWELLCPLCRGAGETGKSLSEINSQVHCDTCRIDFTVNFDRFVEVTFKPNALLRQVQAQNFCMGSPQKTPHIVAQQLLPAGSERELSLPLEPGRYRLRALELSGGQDVTVTDAGQPAASVTIGEAGWPAEELKLAQQVFAETGKCDERRTTVDTRAIGLERSVGYCCGSHCLADVSRSVCFGGIATRRTNFGWHFDSLVYRPAKLHPTLSRDWRRYRFWTGHESLRRFEKSDRGRGWSLSENDRRCRDGRVSPAGFGIESDVERAGNVGGAGSWSGAIDFESRSPYRSLHRGYPE